ncbi:MAG: cation diffusion facilitator family transporter [Bacteroidia bacterium]|nr:cation diffusion facilitator family transporter [Bacteroidia bacterium]NNF31480.1 cation transporter [Flavobacteriaceae bacterium]MBT8275555.1 cation diffusion facilitator family transporter [Bacteroidia bacterium]NNJ82045.1 cation transporter [Flavobacteriaceae bacterium]NNK54059.1 cation transporter [Flavobacteriaceae bacterium]
MGHNHSHHHQHDHSDVKGRNLLISIFLNIIITVAQVIGGIVSGSLALISDALHNFSDVLSLIISYVANRFAKKKASFNRTFGYKRAEIIAAFVNAATLLVVAVYLIYEAILRFFNPQDIKSGLVIWLALLGILANGLSVLLLRKSSRENMNMRSAYLHLLTDMSASVAVLVGGLLMKYFGWFWVDSVLTVLIAVYLIIMGYDLLRSSFRVLMLFSPEDVDLEKLRSAISAHPEIKNVHHIHIWQLNEQENHLEAHIDFHNDITLSEFDAILDEVELILHDEFGINHVNIQPEYQKDDPKEIIVQD